MKIFFFEILITNRCKELSLLLLMIWNINVSGQTCYNPEARLNKLKSATITKDTLYKWINKDLDLLNLHSGDTVADIGSYDGYYPILYSIFNDSIVFYLNDIKNDGFIYFDSIRTISEKISENEISNEFIIVIGNDSSTQLQVQKFDKIIIRDALHHFNSIEKMLEEIAKMMKPDAELILIEPILGQNNINQICQGAMTEVDLLDLMSSNGFVLTRKIEGKKSLSWFKFMLSTK